jgi:hypothetical protein
MSAFLSSVPKLQFFDANGDPLAGGKLYTYAAGTTTPLATYTDSTGTTPNTNPIILDSRGEANVWLTAVAYKFELKTSADALIWTVDNISNALNLSQLLANSGSAANPPYTFAADPTTGMYLGAVGQIALSANGTPVLRSSDTAMTIGQAGGSNDVDTTVYGDFSVNGLLEVTSSSNPSQAFYRPATTGTVGRITWEGRDTVASRVSYARIEGEITSPLTGTHTGNLNFYTATAGALTEKMRIDASGNVGIGNTPTVKLDVQGAGTIRGFLTATDAIKLGANTSAPATTDAFVFRPANNTLAFGTASTEQMRIDSSGNVGVGFAGTTPSIRMHIQNTTATTNAVTQILRIDSQSSGTPANGIGVGMEFATETAAGNTEIGATIEAITTDVTSTSEDFDLSFKTMTAGAAATEKARLTSTGLLQFNSGYGSVATAYGCRAWINFNGTGTPAARASGNVSSITDNAAGDYTLNFTTAFPDANYAPVFGYGQADAAAGYKFAVRIGTAETGSPTTMTTTALRIISGVPSPTDFANLYVAIFR